MKCRDPILVIGGCPRSGTTLVRNMLDCHPSVAVPGESYFVFDVMRRLIAAGALGDVPLAWSAIQQHEFFQRWELDPAAVQAEIGAEAPRWFGDLLRLLFTTYAATRGKPAAADKTTSNALHFELLADLFPASRFVHVVRDPRSACMSLSLQAWVRWGLAEAATVWRNHVERVAEAAAVLDDRLHEVRYEGLIADPRQELAALCSFAGLAFDDAMLRFPGAPGQPAARHHRAARRPVGPDPRRWRDEMSTDEIAIVELVAGEAMERLGYAPVTGRLARTRALPELLAFKARSRADDRILNHWGMREPPLPRRWVGAR